MCKDIYLVFLKHFLMEQNILKKVYKIHTYGLMNNYEVNICVTNTDIKKANTVSSPEVPTWPSLL